MLGQKNFSAQIDSPATLDVSGLDTLADRIDFYCDQYEAAFRREEHPQISAYLEHCTAADRGDLLVELILVDWELRNSIGGEPTWEEYRQRFGDFAGEIERARFKQQNVAHGDSQKSAQAQRRIAQFELLELLGTGAAGEVWKARDPRLQRTVAVKIPRRLSLSDEELDRFLREARSAGQLDHSGIVTVFETGRDGPTPYIISSYVAGTSLKQRLQSARFNPAEAARLCVEIAEALEHAHGRGVIHRDLKPSNILIDEEGHPHIADFGLAKWTQDAGDLTLDGQLLGTPAYMSPEQARGESSRSGAATDIYALGTMLYEMLAGQPPFRGTRDTLIFQIIHKEPAAPSTFKRNLPRDLETICLKAIAKDPARRYRTAREMAVDLERFS